MWRSILVLLTALSFVNITTAQETNEVALDSVIDTKYREDQFYIGATYNIFINKPEGMKQSGFSTGFHLGFIRDFPVNKNRTYAIGVGLGLSTNTFNQNLGISKVNNTASYNVLDPTKITFTRNRYFTHLVELPIEFRWRNSTPSSYKFWRVYPGFKMGYMFANAYKYVGEPQSLRYTNLDVFNKLQYGVTLSGGYNTWNIHVYYALNPLLNDAKLQNGTAINANVIKVGLLFYIL